MRKLSNEVLKCTKIPKSKISTITILKKERLFSKSGAMDVFVEKRGGRAFKNIVSFA